MKNLVTKDEYSRKVLPFLKTEYFTNIEDNVLFNEIKSFILKYNTLPNQAALLVEIDQTSILKEDQIASIKDSIKNFDKIIEPNDNDQWLIDQTENFCQEKAIYHAMMESIEIMNNKNNMKDKGEIPQLLTDALGVSFDTSVGHDFLLDSDKRFEYYHTVEFKIPFDLEYFNTITKGGVAKKTLNIVMGGTGVGKTHFMCHLAASYLNQNKNILYITLEMAEEEISKRIDANLLNITMDDLIQLPKDLYDRRIEAYKSKTSGKLIVKQYPTAAASSIHFKSLLNELFLKKNFKPDIIFIDYINICSSARLKAGAITNSYLYVKAIAEELRGLAIEHDVAIWSATQTNREGFSSSDAGLENVAESFGLPATSDFMFVLITTEDLEKLNQMMAKQLKNRYNSKITNKRFIIGVDQNKMRFYDVEQTAQVGLTDTKQVSDASKKKFLELDVED